jgi:hypothetical protein
MAADPTRGTVDAAALDRALKARARLDAETNRRDPMPAPPLPRQPQAAAPTRATPPVDEPRRAPQDMPAALPTVQQLCSDRSNIFSEHLCQTRACRKAEYAADPICVHLDEVERARQRTDR